MPSTRCSRARRADVFVVERVQCDRWPRMRSQYEREVRWRRPLRYCHCDRGVLRGWCCSPSFRLMRGSAQQPPRRSASAADHAARLTTPPPKLDDALPAMAAAARRTSGTARSTAGSMHSYVVEQARFPGGIATQGHPKFWGRIIGTSSDVESARVAGGEVQGARPVRRAHSAARSRAAMDAADLGRRRHAAAARPIHARNRAARLRRRTHCRPAAWTSRPCTSGLGSEADFAGKDVDGQGGVLVQHDGHAGPKARSEARRRERRGGDLRSRHAAGQHALPGVPVRHEGAGVRRRRATTATRCAI